MKVLFLDIDGVLNSRGYDRQRNWNELTNIDQTRLPLVREIVEKTGARIVLTSTWRGHWNADRTACDESGRYIEETFEKHRLSISDKTPDLGLRARRTDEIRAWLAEHEDVESFVILDDGKFGWEELADYCVFTNPYAGKGLEEEHVVRATEVLNSHILRG